MSRSFKFAAIAIFTAVLGLGVQSSKAEQVITAGGWTITSPNGIALVSDGVSSGTLILEKEADFVNPVGGLIINFSQTSANAASTIEIQGESVVNSSGATWGGFDFLLLPLGGQTFTGSVFAPPSDQPGGSFTTVSSSSTAVDYAGGSQPTSGIPLFWGGEVGPTSGVLLINADPDSSLTHGVGTVFGFKELPVSVPLPAAALQSLAGVAGLGLFGLIKKSIRKSVA